MSILGNATTSTELVLQTIVFVLVPLGIAGAIIFVSGSWRGESVVGPERVDHPSDALGMFIVMLLAAAAWVVTPLLVLTKDDISGLSAGGKANGPATVPVDSSTTLPVDSPTTLPGDLPKEKAANLPTSRVKVSSTKKSSADSGRSFRMTLGSIAGGSVGFAIIVGTTFAMRMNGLHLIGLTWRRFSGKALIAGIVVTLCVVFPAAILTEMGWRSIGFEHPTEHELLKISGESASSVLRAMVNVAAVMVAPVFEETLFRGLLQTVIGLGIAVMMGSRDENGVPQAGAMMRWVGIVVAAMMFAWVHDTWTMPPLFVFGIIMGYTYERTGNLWHVILMHASFNATSIVLYHVGQGH